MDKFYEWLDYAMDNFTNDQMVDYLTHPYGLGGMVAVILIAIFLRQKNLFVIVTTLLSVMLIIRYVFSDTANAAYTIALMVVSMVALGGFVIYNSFISED